MNKTIPSNDPSPMIASTRHDSFDTCYSSAFNNTRIGQGCSVVNAASVASSQSEEVAK